MSASLPNRTTTDGYTAANSLTAPDTARITLTVANAAIYYQLGRGPIPRYEEQEVFALPGVHSLERVCSGVRVRSATPGTPAQVSIDAVTASEVGQ